jgi:hypothetical protein
MKRIIQILIDVILVHHQIKLSKKNKINQLFIYSLFILNRRTKSSQKKVSSNRTVLISNRSTISNENQDNIETIEISNDNQNSLNEEIKVKRIKVDPLSPSSNTIDKLDNEINQKDLSLKSIVTVPTTTDEHDYRRNLNEKRRVSSTSSSVISTIDNFKTESSRSRSREKSKDHHRRSSTNSHNSKTESNEKSKNYSRSSKDNQYRHQHEHKRSSDLSNRHSKQYSNQLSDRHDIFNGPSFRNSLSSIYTQRNNDLTLPGNLHRRQQPIPHKRFNYNHQRVVDHPRFANPNTLPSPTPLMDFDFSQSPPHHHGASSVSIGDRK